MKYKKPKWPLSTNQLCVLVAAATNHADVVVETSGPTVTSLMERGLIKFTKVLGNGHYKVRILAAGVSEVRPRISELPRPVMNKAGTAYRCF